MTHTVSLLILIMTKTCTINPKHRLPNYFQLFSYEFFFSTGTCKMQTFWFVLFADNWHDALEGTNRDSRKSMLHLPRRIQNASAARMSTHILRGLRNQVVGSRTNVPPVSSQNRRWPVMERRFYHAFYPAFLNIHANIRRLFLKAVSGFIFVLIFPRRSLEKEHSSFCFVFFQCDPIPTLEMKW